MRIILFLLLLSSINLIAQNNSYNLLKGVSNDTNFVYINEPPNLDLSFLVGSNSIEQFKPIAGLNLALRMDFQEAGVDTYLGKELDTSNPCFLCHKEQWKLNTIAYFDFGLPLTFKGNYPNKYGVPRYITSARIDTNADISAVFKVNLKKLKVKLLLGQSSGFQLHFLFF